MAQDAAYTKRNLAWPLQWRSAGLRQVTLVARYEAALLHLARTPRGSLYSDPDYGTTIYRLRTQGAAEALLEAVTEDLRRAAAAYIPDILIHELRAEFDETIQKLKVSIFWTIDGATQQMHGDLARTHVAVLSI